MIKGLIKKHEGWRSKVYLDTLGNRTVGYGFNIEDNSIAKFIPAEVKSGEKELDREQAEEILDRLVEIAEFAAQAYIGQKTYGLLTPARQAVLVDMAYNMGINKLMQFKKLREAIIAQKYDIAGLEMKNSRWYRQVPNRVEELFKLLIRG